jgi:hypothetical protein
MVKSAIIASLLAVCAVLLIKHESWDKAWQSMQPDLAAKI